MKKTFWKVWGTPAIIGILSAIGLFSALTGDGFYDLISWLALGVPVVVTVWFLAKKKKTQRTGRIKSVLTQKVRPETGR